VTNERACFSVDEVLVFGERINAEEVMESGWGKNAVRRAEGCNEFGLGNSLRKDEGERVDNCNGKSLA
jgi:hypothetical protein